jgi:hypothetical protein
VISRRELLATAACCAGGDGPSLVTTTTCGVGDNGVRTKCSLVFLTRRKIGLVSGETDPVAFRMEKGQFHLSMLVG